MSDWLSAPPPLPPFHLQQLKLHLSQQKTSSDKNQAFLSPVPHFSNRESLMQILNSTLVFVKVRPFAGESQVLTPFSHLPRRRRSNPPPFAGKRLNHNLVPALRACPGYLRLLKDVSRFARSAISCYAMCHVAGSYVFSSALRAK